MDTKEIEARINAANTPEAMLEVRESVLALEQRASELRKRIDGAMTEHLEAGEEIEGWYLKYPETIRCRDVRGAFNAIAMKDAGDGKTIESCLSSSAIKHGAARGVLGDEWDNYFEVTRNAKLVEGEPPKKKLTQVNTFNK